MNRNAEVYSYSLKKERKRRTIALILFLICFYITVNLAVTFLVYPVYQKSVSMIPDLPQDSVVMVSPLFNKYERGDIVLLQPRKSSNVNFFKHQADRFVRFFTAQQISILANTEQPSSKSHLRRIVGIPGDTIYMRDYVLYIKPAGEKHFLTEFEITGQPYNVTFFVPPADWDTEIGVKGSFDEVTLGYNQYFVLADNRKSSDDSRLWGTVDKDSISAKVLMCYFPFKSFRLF